MRRAVVLAAISGMLPLAVIAAPSAWAQEPPDRTGDGTINCDDFRSQAEAQAEYERTKPADPHGLDGVEGETTGGDPGIACEGDDAFGVIEDLGTSGLDPATTGAPYVGPPVGSVPAAPVAPPVGQPPANQPRGETVSYLDAVPADVLARIDRCAAVAVGRRRVVASGCADGRNVVWRQDRGAPDLKRTAATRWVMPDWWQP